MADSDPRAGLDRFLAQQETRAYRMALAMTQNTEDALDLVQDSMLRLVRSYADCDEAQWTPLFYRILNNRIRDFHRRRKLWRWLPFLEDGVFRNGESAQPGTFDAGNPVDAPAQAFRQPDQELSEDDGVRKIHQALGELPLRQQQVFLMRAAEEFSTRETAAALGISEASVKTHYRRALQQLRQKLGSNTGDTA